MFGFRLLVALALICLIVPAAAGQTIRFTAINDINGAPQFDDVCIGVNEAGGPGQFIITAGDIVTAGYTDLSRPVNNFLTHFGPSVEWYPTYGNHEANDGTFPHLRAWNLANVVPKVNPGPDGTRETTYSFDVGPVHFVALNQYWNGGTAADSDAANKWRGTNVPALRAWLEADLAATDKRWIVVYGHEPAYPTPDERYGDIRHGGNSLDRDPAARDDFWRILNEYNVTAYVCGHSHRFSMVQPNGNVWQVNNSAAMGDSQWDSFVIFEASETEFVIKGYRPYGNFRPYLAPGDPNRNPFVLMQTIVIPATTESTVTGCHVFYNNSLFDGYFAYANAQDDNAIAVDKTPLRPGETATFANYTSFIHGINGIMVDLHNSPEQPNLSDFSFRTGNDNNPDGWTAAPTPSMSTRAGAGVDGADRMTFIWQGGSITNKWLEVTVKASVRTGLEQDEVFYYGNAIGESGNDPGLARVDTHDEIAARHDPHKNTLNPASITNNHDFNRDGKVDTLDEIIARIYATNFLTDLKLISPPAQP